MNKKLSDDDFIRNKEIQSRLLKTDTIDFIAELLEEIRTNVYVTLTYKNINLTREQISKIVSHFISYLNRAIFSNSYKRKQKSIAVISFIETLSKQKQKINAHAHLSIRVPDEYVEDIDKLKSLISKCHEKTDYSNRVIDVQRQDTRRKRFAAYHTKETFKAVDLKNLIMTNSEHSVLQRQSLH